jgi:hypothetical protein
MFEKGVALDPVTRCSLEENVNCVAGFIGKPWWITKLYGQNFLF